jgi:hypothetical protein
VTGEQVLVLLLLSAAFAAGWFARGGSPREATADAEDAVPEDDPLLAEADAALGRALTAARAARAMASASGPAAATAREAALGVLDRRVDELETLADRLEERLGTDHDAFDAFDRAVSDVLRARREVDGDAALSGATAARDEWRRVAGVPAG